MSDNITSVDALLSSIYINWSKLTIISHSELREIESKTHEIFSKNIAVESLYRADMQDSLRGISAIKGFDQIIQDYAAVLIAIKKLRGLCSILEQLKTFTFVSFTILAIILVFTFFGKLELLYKPFPLLENNLDKVSLGFLIYVISFFFSSIFSKYNGENILAYISSTLKTYERYIRIGNSNGINDYFNNSNIEFEQKIDNIMNFKQQKKGKK